MRRSEINRAIRRASECFTSNGWALPPEPRWDVTDFGLGDFDKYGLALVALAEEKEYGEKLMYARKNQTTPAHCHGKKKEDIIVRFGTLSVQVWKGKPGGSSAVKFPLKTNGRMRPVTSGEKIRLEAGERVTLEQGIYHEFHPETEECIIGEVSTANDDLHDNFFVNPDIGRFPEIHEDEPAILKLLSDA